MLNFCDFIQVYDFTKYHHLKEHLLFFNEKGGDDVNDRVASPGMYPFT